MTIRVTLMNTLVIALCLAAPAGAATFGSLDRDEFATATSGRSTRVETFDDQPLGVLQTDADVQFSTRRDKLVVTDKYLSTSGNNVLGAGLNRRYFQPTQKVTVTFAAPVSAFAIDVNTFSKRNGAFKARLDNGDLVRSVFAPFPGLTSDGKPISTGQYISFVSDSPINSFTIFTRRFRTFNLDTLVYAPAAVPVPGSLPLLLAGLAALTVIRKRRKQSD